MTKRTATKLTVEPTIPSIISGDLGNAYGNIKADQGIEIDFRSVQGRISDANRMSELPFDHCLQIDGSWYVFGEEAYKLAPRTLEDFPATSRYTDIWYKRLFTYALHRVYGIRLGEGWISPRIVLSIPAALFKNDGIVEQIKANLVSPYKLITTHAGCTPMIQVSPENLTIIPEGAGSYLAAAASSKPMESGLWLVVDVGYLTTDIVAFLDGDYLPDLAASDPAAGMSSVAQAVANHIAAASGVDLPASTVDRDLRCPAILINGITIPIEEQRNAALTRLGERIGRFLVQHAARQNVSGVLLTGGGAELLRDRVHARGLPGVSIAPNPRRANVEGGYKLLDD